MIFKELRSRSTSLKDFLVGGIGLGLYLNNQESEKNIAECAVRHGTFSASIVYRYAEPVGAIITVWHGIFSASIVYRYAEPVGAIITVRHGIFSASIVYRYAEPVGAIITVWHGIFSASIVYSL